MTAASSALQGFPQETTLPEDAVPHHVPLTRAVLRAWNCPFEKIGENYPESLLEFREDTIESLPWFTKHAGRSFVPVSGFLGLQRRRLLESGASPENLAEFDGNAPGVLHSLVIAGWAVEKIAIGFSRSVVRTVLGSGPWWHDCTCEWLLEHYRAMSIFLRLPGDGISALNDFSDLTGLTDLKTLNELIDGYRDEMPGAPAGATEDSLSGGCLTGLTVREDGPALFCQLVEPDGFMPPAAYFEIPLRPGVTLGTIEATLRYDHICCEVLAKTETGTRDVEAFRRRMTGAMRAVAGTAMPLLIAALGDDYDRRCFSWDPWEGGVSLLGSRIPFHDPDVSGDELLNAMASDAVTVVEITKPARRDLN